MTSKAKKMFYKILACGLAAVVILSACLPLFAETSDKKEDGNIIYNDDAEGSNPNLFDYTNLITKTYGDRGHIDVDSGNFVVNLDGVKSDIRFFGVRYDIAKEGIPTGDRLNNMVSELAAHGYNLIVIDDVYSVLKNSSNFTDFSEFLSALYEANMYAGIGLFSTSSLKVNSDSKGAAILDRDTVRRAQSFIKRFFGTKNTFRSDENVTVTYGDDTTIAFVTYCSDLDIGADALCYSSLQKEFNEWLLDKYGSTEVIRGLYWVNEAGESILGEEENAKRGTILTPTEPVYALYTDALSGRQREADFGRFLISYVSEQFNILKELIRSVGCQAPILISDNDSTAFNVCISGGGDASRGDFAFTPDMTVKEAISQAALGTVANKPYIAVWDTSATATAEEGEAPVTATDSELISEFISLVSYASYQGWDALVVGDYSETSENSTNKNAALWDNSGFMATLFRHTAVAASYGSNFGIAYSGYDTVMDFGRFKNSTLASALIAKTENVFFDTDYTADPNFKIVMSSGNTSSGSYEGANSNKENGTKAIIQSVYPYRNASFSELYMNKAEWINDQGIISANGRIIENLDGIDVYFGEGKAIVPDGIIETSKQLATAFDRLGFTSYRDPEDASDLGCYSSDGLLITDNGRLFYNENSDSLVGFGTRYFLATGDLSDETLNAAYTAYLNRYYYNSSTEQEYRNIKVSASGASGNGTIAVYALGSGTNNDTASRFLVYAKSADGSPLTATLNLIRENTVYKAYGIRRDGYVGMKGALLNPDNTVSDSSGRMNITLNGEYDYYIITLEETDLDAALEGYDPNDSIPEHQNLFWYIVIPAVFFLVVVYSAILISDNLKVKREERLRVATRKVTLGKTGKYASALDVADDTNSGRTKGTPGIDIFAEDEEERRRRENPWEREDGTIDFTKIVRSDDDDENAW